MKFDEMKERFKTYADKKTYNYAKKISEEIYEYGELRQEKNEDYEQFSIVFNEIYLDWKPMQRVKIGRIGDEYCVEENHSSPEDGTIIRTFFSKKISLDEFYKLESLRVALMDLIHFYAFHPDPEHIKINFDLTDNEKIHWTEYNGYEGKNDTFENKVERLKFEQN